MISIFMKSKHNVNSWFFSTSVKLQLCIRNVELKSDLQKILSNSFYNKHVLQIFTQIKHSASRNNCSLVLCLMRLTKTPFAMSPPMHTGKIAIPSPLFTIIRGICQHGYHFYLFLKVSLQDVMDSIQLIKRKRANFSYWNMTLTSLHVFKALYRKHWILQVRTHRRTLLIFSSSSSSTNWLISQFSQRSDSH